MRIRASVTAVGPGGTTTVYALAVLGPVKSANAANALAAGSPVALKSATGVVLATASASVPNGRRTARRSPSRRPRALKGRYQRLGLPRRGRARAVHQARQAPRQGRAA